MLLLEWWRNVSIAKKLYLAVGLMAFLLVGELLTVRFAMHTLSAARAFVGGEGLWSKSQKNAAISLLRYGRTEDEADFASFLSYMDVPEGDHQARIELFKPEPDLSIVRAGFLRGHIHPDDIEPMIDLLRRFYFTSYLSRAIAVWGSADDHLTQFKAAGLAYRAAIISGDTAQASEHLANLKQLNESLTSLEDEFSYVLGVGSRWLEHIVLVLLSIAVLVVETIGLTLTLLTSRSISRGLRALNEAAMHIGGGDFSHAVVARSKDEIGQLAHSVNQMGQMLQQSYSQLEVRVNERTSELARSRDQLDVILKGITDGITVVDETGRFIFVNETGARMCGASSVEEFLSTPQTRFFENLEVMDEHGNPFPLRTLPSQQAFNGLRNPPETIIRSRPRGGGDERWSLVKSAPVLDESGQTKLVVTIFKDFTERKRSEDAVKYLDDASQILASSMSYKESLRKVGELSTQRLADWCLIDLADAAGKSESLAIIHSDPAVAEQADDLRRTYAVDWTAPFGAPQILAEVELPATLRPLRVSSAMVVPLLASGKIFGVITFLSTTSKRRYDSTDLRVAQELARRAGIAIENATLYELAQQAIHLRDEFLSIASHELKTPLTSLSLQLQMAQERLKRLEGEGPSLQAIARGLDISGKQVVRLTRLIDDLLDVSRVQAGKLTFTFEKVCLSEVVREVASRFSDQLTKVGTSLTLDIENDVRGRFDQTRIEQIIDNLLTNATKYASGKPVTVSLVRRDGHALLVVEDRGPGIPADSLSRIFERFERAAAPSNSGGLGLGLFIVKEIVVGHGGSIAVESQLGEGTRFTTTLPLVGAAEGADHGA